MDNCLFAKTAIVAVFLVSFTVSVRQLPDVPVVKAKGGLLSTTKPGAPIEVDKDEVLLKSLRKRTLPLEKKDLTPQQSERSANLEQLFEKLKRLVDEKQMRVKNKYMGGRKRSGLDDSIPTNNLMERLIRRRRAEDAVKVVVDILVLADNALYSEMLETHDHVENNAIKALKEYFALLLNLINLRYKEIEDPSLKIRIRLAGIYIAEDPEGSPWSTDFAGPSKNKPNILALNPNEGLKALRKWLPKQTDQLPKYDHVMAFTGYFLQASGFPSAGMAYIGGICETDRGYSTSIIEFTGGLAEAGTAAHELGHNLGAQHDGHEDNKDCPADQNYLMAPTASPVDSILRNYFRFSPCSIRQFKKLLSTSQADCLRRSKGKKLELTSLPGQTLTPDDQCNQVFGGTSEMCKMEDTQENICASLWCTTPSGPKGCITRGHLNAVYGTPCGTNKICRSGQCIDSGTLNTAKSSEEIPNLDEYEDEINGPKSHETEIEEPVQNENVNQDIPGGCRADLDPVYCHVLLEGRPDACTRSDIFEFCCFSCIYL